ncbi:MAG: hypothetical protein HYT87_15045 [Nitrospirae bacterium]|nr:hypothetical protein [Nitrospirota bacterium]
MLRDYLFEFEDFQWFPVQWRDYMTDCLRYLNEVSHAFDPIVPKMVEWLRAHDTERIIDMGSGGSGPQVRMESLFRKAGYPVRITLTDKYPNTGAFHRAAQESGGRIEFISTPVDAAAVPHDLKGVRTIFNAFHHMPSPVARAILRDAVESGAPIGIFEVVEQRMALPAIGFVPIGVLLSAPLIRPPKLQRLLLTYLVPVLPFFTMWDGVVSCMRVFTPRQLERLTEGLTDGNGYRFEIGRLSPGIGRPRITYLLGWTEATAHA